MLEGNDISEIDLETLTKSQWASLIWAFFWRGIVVSLGSGVTGAIAGGILGFIMGFVGSALGINIETMKPIIQVIGGLAGLVVGFLFMVVFVKWLFKARFNDFRLALVDVRNNEP